MWPTKSVEVWDWELSPTADRKVRGVFQNATSQPVFRCDLCDFLDNIELMCSSPRVWDQNARNILLVFTILCMPSLCFIVINLCHNFIYLFILSFILSFIHLLSYMEKRLSLLYPRLWDWVSPGQTWRPVYLQSTGISSGLQTWDLQPLHFKDHDLEWIELKILASRPDLGICA